MCRAVGDRARRTPREVFFWMGAVAIGLVMARRLPRSPLLAALRSEPRLRIVFEVYDLRHLPSGQHVEDEPAVIVADSEAAIGVRTLISAIRARFPTAPIVVLDRAGDVALAQRARNLGAAAVLTRRSGPERFIARLLAIGAEEVYEPSRAAPQLYDQLTPREWDILPYLAQRFSAREIADDLTLSYATVRTHIRNIYAKCGVGSRRHAAQMAVALLSDGKKGNNEVKEVSADDELRRRDGRADS